tara:strand:+ start:749 stop:988 length:240 start_codon:yes stop_codon:yes gene_type:complete
MKIQLEKALAEKDGKYIMYFLEDILLKNNKKNEDGFVKSFNGLPPSMKMDIIAIGLTNMVSEWLGGGSAIKDFFSFGRN